MTTALLILLVLVELARLVLQYRSGKTYAERQDKTYCTTYEVENTREFTDEDCLHDVLSYKARLGYELVAVTHNGFNKSDNKHYYTLFFTKKKIKNFTEE